MNLLLLSQLVAIPPAHSTEYCEQIRTEAYQLMLHRQYELPYLYNPTNLLEIIMNTQARETDIYVQPATKTLTATVFADKFYLACTQNTYGETNGKATNPFEISPGYAD